MIVETKVSRFTKFSAFLDKVLNKSSTFPIVDSGSCAAVLCPPAQNSEKDYGWLEPNGTFHTVKWGEHQEFAFDIIRKRNWFDDFGKNYGHPYTCAGDYLTETRGWVLLHNPSHGIAYVTRSVCKRMTKAQAEFLYDYYQKRGMPSIASQYIDAI